MSWLSSTSRTGAASPPPEGSWGDTHWVVCRLTETRRRDAIDLRPHPAELADDPADVPVHGTSLAMLLDAALDSGGDISHLETGRLSDLR